MSDPAQVRALMRKTLQERKAQVKIVHPFAKYNPSGLLLCQLCNITIKTEALWNPHLLSLKHKENIEYLKEKRSTLGKRDRTESIEDETSKKKIDVKALEEESKVFETREREESETSLSLPADFFDNEKEATTVTKSRIAPEKSNSLPHNFFTGDNKKEQIDLSKEWDNFKETIATDLEAVDIAQQEKELKERQVQDKQEEQQQRKRQGQMESIRNKSLQLKELRNQKMNKLKQDKESIDSSKDAEENDYTPPLDLFDWRMRGEL